MSEQPGSRMPLADLLVFHQLTRSLTSSFDLDTILRTILDHMEHTVGADLWTLLMQDEKSKELHYAIAAGGEQEALRDLRVKVGEGIAGWVVEHGETLIVPEATHDPRLESDPQAKRGIVRSVIALPLRGRKGTHGVIEIYNPRAEQLTDYTIAFLHILADHAAIAIENARDVSRIQQLTITDDTTGLYNVRHLYDVLERELNNCLRHNQPLGLAFIDLDRFKLVNDAHGHLIGSELLTRVGQRLKKHSRKQDWCFRYGGDEFVILLPETSAVQANAHANSLLRHLMSTPFRMKNGLEVSVSASIGLATAPTDGEDVHSMIGVADARMYMVKSSGRGKVLGG
jgi:diguanylate cyclase (GGDEF)-like protein